MNPAPRPRKPSLKRMIGLGTQVLAHLNDLPEVADLPEAQAQITSDWTALSKAWTSHAADRRCALTRLQETLAQWTADYPWVAASDVVQRYRKQLHLVLDH